MLKERKMIVYSVGSKQTLIGRGYWGPRKTEKSYIEMWNPEEGEFKVRIFLEVEKHSCS